MEQGTGSIIQIQLRVPLGIMLEKVLKTRTVTIQIIANHSCSVCGSLLLFFFINFLLIMLLTVSNHSMKRGVR